VPIIGVAEAAPLTILRGVIDDTPDTRRVSPALILFARACLSRAALPGVFDGGEGPAETIRAAFTDVLTDGVIRGGAVCRARGVGG